jgi:membrane-associated protease RseP (regulator of RpoE activity)
VGDGETGGEAIDADAVAVPPRPWRTNAILFVVTVASVLFTQAQGRLTELAGWIDAAKFAGSLLGILVTHEAAHYIAARWHKVEASLPYFIPLPMLSPFGTMGAIIRMRGTIPTRRALLDIGASGPLAGLLVAIPLYAWGAAHSKVIAIGATEGVELGEPILVKLIDHFVNPTAAGYELELSAVAFGAWAGMFVTMINLLPVGQLDGGHVAYAMFGPRQNKIAQWVHRSLLAFFFVSLVSFMARDLRAGLGLARIGTHVGNSLFWLVWFEVLAVLGSLSSRRDPSGDGGEERKPDLDLRTRLVTLLGLVGLAEVGRAYGGKLVWIAWFIGLGALIAMEVKSGALRATASTLDHPPTGDGAPGPARVLVGVIALVMFVLLFMVTPVSM